MARAERYDLPVGIVMCGLDHFKLVNDTHGHLAGDEVLRVFAELLKKHARSSDIVCRFGGEEFALLMPGAAAGNAYRVAERIRRRVERLNPGPELAVSVSIGVGSGEGTSPADPQLLLEEADRALYAAKAAGRNRTEIFLPSAPLPASLSAMAVRLG